jgi:hypothetical protein
MSMKLLFVFLRATSFFALSFSSANALFSHPIFPKIQCLLHFLILNPDLGRFGEYTQFLRNESVMTLAQAGNYEGPDDIEEYVKFVWAANSPYILSDGGPGGRAALGSISYDRESGLCEMLTLHKWPYVMDPNTTLAASEFSLSFMMKFYMDFKEKYITRINVFYTESFLDVFFNVFLNTNQTREYVCSVLSGSCDGIVNTTASCEDDLALLPTIDDPGKRADGNTQGCRGIHVVFADTNPKHCPHVSLTATPDHKGRIKCQSSANIQVDSLFTDRDVKKYQRFSRRHNIDPDLGHDYVV